MRLWKDKKIMNGEEKNFWKRFVEWTLADIDICLKYKANVGAAKLICAAIDSFGSFYIGRGFKSKENDVRPKGGSGHTQAEKAGSRDAFIAFVSNYMPNLKKFVLGIEGIGRKNGAELLYDHFRNGLIHEGLPEIGIGIARKRDKRILLSAEGYIALVNLFPLKSALKSAVKQYTKELNAKNQPERLQRWRDRFNHLKRFKIKKFRQK